MGGEVYRDICKQEGTETESRTDAGHKDDAWIGVGRGHIRPCPPVRRDGQGVFTDGSDGFSHCSGWSTARKDGPTLKIRRPELSTLGSLAQLDRTVP